MPIDLGVCAKAKVAVNIKRASGIMRLIIIAAFFSNIKSSVKFRQK